MRSSPRFNPGDLVVLDGSDPDRTSLVHTDLENTVYVVDRQEGPNLYINQLDGTPKRHPRSHTGYYFASRFKPASTVADLPVGTRVRVREDLVTETGYDKLNNLTKRLPDGLVATADMASIARRREVFEITGTAYDSYVRGGGWSWHPASLEIVEATPEAEQATEEPNQTAETETADETTAFAVRFTGDEDASEIEAFVSMLYSAGLSGEYDRPGAFASDIKRYPVIAIGDTEAFGDEVHTRNETDSAYTASLERLEIIDFANSARWLIALGRYLAARAEKVAAEPVYPKTIGTYAVRVNDDGSVSVGCTTYSADDVARLAAFSARPFDHLVKIYSSGTVVIGSTEITAEQVAQLAAASAAKTSPQENA